jgi:1-acyl-sn-glycerol-3-phosphate acyltransferase
MFYWFVKGMFFPFARLYLRLTREGLENLPRSGPAIVVANHASYADPVILGSAFPRPVHFIVLQSMFDLLVLRWFYWGMGTIPVGLEGQDSSGIKRALRVLSQGRAHTVLPVGGRFPRPGRVHVRFGPPLRFGGRKRRPEREALIEFSKSMLDAVRRLEPGS